MSAQKIGVKRPVFIMKNRANTPKKSAATDLFSPILQNLSYAAGFIPTASIGFFSSFLSETKGTFMYQNFIKRLADFLLALIGAIVLLPVFLIIAVSVAVDDPGPVFFTQKRVGKGKKLFSLHKFRSMKVKTPDIPTHLLHNPEQYITRVGGFLRKTSLDELPQIYDILFGKMSVVGPRPALWNQADLIAEREKYGANDVRPGLTGWAQINGRDELEIPVKAKLDGDYVRELSAGHFRGFRMDIRCFFGTIVSVLRHDGVVEGGTGELKKEAQKELTGK